MRKLILNAAGTREDLQIIRNAGWDGVFTGWTGLEETVATAQTIRELGLIYQSIHAPFRQTYQLWEGDAEEAEKEVQAQISCLQSAAAVGVDLVVMHTIIGMDRATPNDVGIERYGRIFDAAKALGVRVALENTEGEVYLAALMNAFAEDGNVGFCWDTGHELCYNGGRDVVGMYGNRLFGTHLNDNMGVTGSKITWHDDAHMLPFDGIVDWNGVAARLKRENYGGMLIFELQQHNKPQRHTSDRYEEMSYADFVAEALARARRFGALME